MTAYFQLERSKKLKDNTHPVYLVLKIKEAGKEKKFRSYTGLNVLPSYWIGTGSKKRVNPKSAGATTINQRLATLRAGAESIIMNAKILKVAITLEYFRERFNKEVLGKTEPEQTEPATVKLSFFDYLQNFIEQRQNIFQPATIKTYITLKKSLQEFEKASGYKVAFDTINQQFITLYTKYLIEETEVINNTVAKRVATLKAFLGEMKKQKDFITGQKINAYNDFEDFQASRNYDTTIMYLTESELLQLQNLEIASNTTAEHVRDVFCFAGHTGIRYSDWERLTPNNIVSISHNDKIVQVLKCTMFKVHKEVIVPLSEYALSIIEKYKDYAAATGKLFPVYTNQETNRTLKEVAKEAKINEVLNEVKKSGAKRINYTNAKHEILTCHDARNTYATLYLEKGGRPEVLQRLLGHTDIKQTMRYVKITSKAVVQDHINITNREKAPVIPLRPTA